MRTFIILFVLLFSFLNLTAQNCNLNDEAKRHMFKAEGMRETMQTLDDMQLVADEYEQAAQAAPYCPDIYYNLGLCYEELGKKQPELFDKAIAYYRKYLQLSPTADNKSDVEGMIYKIEGKKELYQRQQVKELEKWCGKWNCYYVWYDRDNQKEEIIRGKIDDIEVFLSDGKLNVKALKNRVMTFSSQHGDYHDINNTTDSYQIILPILEDDCITFTYETIHETIFEYLKKTKIYNEPEIRTKKHKYQLHLVSPNRMEGKWLGDNPMGMAIIHDFVSFYFEKQ